MHSVAGLRVSGLVLASAIVSTAAAQERSAGTIEEVTVTAQKRAENLQDVPISMVALPGDTLAKSGANTLDAVQHFAPGLTISAHGSGLVSYTYIRGAGSNLVDNGSDPSVAYFIDEVYVFGASGLQFDLIDLERVEVLKGPQGTLFGRNAAGGAISITTRRPSSTFGVSADLEAGNFDSVLARSSVTGPFSDDGRLLYRLSGSYKRRDGFTENLAGGDDPGTLDSLGGRAQLQFIGDSVELLLSLDALRSRNGMTNQFISTASSAAWVSPEAAATLPGGESYYRHYYNTDGFEEQDLHAITGRIDWDTTIGTLTSISGYRSSRFARLQDQDGTLAESFALESESDDDSFSQEVRFAADTGRLHWIAGLYYFHSRSEQDFSYNAGPAFPTAAVRNRSAADSRILTTDSTAVFGQAKYDLTPKLAVTLGGRYSYDDKEDTHTVRNFLAAAPYTVDPRADWSSFDPALTVDCHVTPDVMTYASYRQGYKSGGFQSTLVSTPALAAAPFDAEHVDSYEVGAKTAWADRRLTVDAALFWSDITDQQILRIIGPAQQIIDNAGATRTKGVDLNVVVKPIANFRVDAAATFQRARFERYQNGTIDLAGNHALRSPDFAGAFSAEYDIPLAGGADLTLRGEYAYQSTRYFVLGSDEPPRVPGFYQPGYGLANARLSYTSSGGNWSVALWGRNLEDTRYLRNLGGSSGSGMGAPGDPRTYGVSFHWSLE